MRQRKSENTMALLGGAALGAMAMYLLDPEAGRRRRENLREATSDTLRTTGAALAPTLESLGERASSWGSTLSDRAADAGSATSSMAGSAYGGARDWLSGVGESLGDWSHRFGRRASHARDSASESARDYADRARRMMPWQEEETSHAGAYTAAGLTAAALGAASIYLFDPTNGKSRRKVVMDQATRIVNDCGRAFHRTGQQVQDMMNRSRGMAHEARKRVMPGGEDVSPETLIQRIRSQMGHHVADAGAIAVMVNRDGVVTLSGPVQAGELDALLAMVNRTPGVAELVNRLDVQGVTAGESATPSM